MKRLFKIILFIPLAIVLESCGGGSTPNNIAPTTATNATGTAGTAGTAGAAGTESNSSSDSVNTTAIDLITGDLSLMVLGSGAATATKSGRASAGYLIFTDGKPRVLMDVGGGTYQRLAESGTNIRDLDTVLLTHLHIDHTADLSAFIKTIYFHNNIARNQGLTTEGRTTPINIYGPAETSFPTERGGQYPNGELIFPPTTNYVNNHYSIGSTTENPTATAGVERYLLGFVNAVSDDTGSGTGVSRFAYTATDLNSNWANAVQETILEAADGLKITAVAVNHGPVPAVAYRVDYKGKSIVYTGDTTSRVFSDTGSTLSEPLIELARDADILVYDTALTDTLPTTPAVRAVHTTPDDIGSVSTSANAKRLVLSHITPATETRLDEVSASIRNQGYQGNISEVNDLDVFNLQ
ncbi:MAG: MBL fold metallo-hydrolase [Endozoicomonadaceae bacterium]|nr:MBL fold metallo-hydrolase [Endozoicomonadaceae bacterium]